MTHNLRSARSRAQITAAGIAFVTIRKGLAVGWRRRRGGGLLGTFVVRITMEGKTRVETLGIADDGTRGMTWAEALDEAQARFEAACAPHEDEGQAVAPLTLNEALQMWLDGKLTETFR